VRETEILKKGWESERESERENKREQELKKGGMGEGE
jgi:hypothetical protein